MNQELRVAQEKVCDNAVIQQGYSGRRFAGLLVSLAELSLPTVPSPGTCALGTDSELERRVVNLLAEKHSTPRKSHTRFGLVLALCMAFVSLHVVLNVRQQSAAMEQSAPRMWGEYNGRIPPIQSSSAVELAE